MCVGGGVSLSFLSGVKNYQLVLICWLVVAGYWSPEAGSSGWVIDVSSTGWD